MKTNQKIHNYIKKIKSIEMTEQEKKIMLTELDRFTRKKSPKNSPYHVFLPFLQSALALGIVSIVSIPLLFQTKPAEEKSDQIFYSMKTLQKKQELKEIHNSERKVSLAIKRTKAQIQKAVELTEDGELSKDRKQEILEAIEKEVSSAVSSLKKIQEVKPEKALPLNNELKRTLEVNKESLVIETKEGQEAEVKTPGIIKEIEKSIEDTEESAKEITETIKKKFDIESTPRAKELSEEEKVLELKKEIISLKLVLEAENELINVSEKHKERQEKILSIISQVQKLKEEKKFGEAFALIQTEISQLKKNKEEKA